METDFAASIFRGACPNCGEASIFKGWIAIHEACPSCGARFERWHGAAFGSVAFGYGVGAIVAAVTAFVMYRSGGLGDNAQYWITGVAIGTVIATYRPVKGWWIAMLHSMGYVYPDPRS